MIGGKAKIRGLVCGLALVFLACVATPATAAPYGQLESWGSYGTGDGELTSPLMAGLDSSDGSVYVGDLSEIGEASGDRDHYRIQKLSPSGAFEGSTLIPRYENIPSNTRILTLFGIAVDPELERLYVLQGGRQNGTFGELVAKRILVFSTNPVEGELVPPAGGPESLPLPTDNTNGLFKPRGIEVDPSNGDLVIMAEKRFSPKYTVFQRFSSSGEAGARFTDEENTLRPGFEEAKVFTVGPEGTIYSMTGRPSEVGIGHTRAFEIPSSMESVSAIPGFAAAAESEEWPYGFQSGGASTPQSGLASGPEIAVSPDGETLYWKEQIAKSLSEENEPGNVLVRGFSLEDLATTVVYGDGPGECRIETSPAGLRAIGEKVVVFDYGPLQEEEAPVPAFGPKVKTFGPGGGGCFEPVAKFKANGVEGDIEITEGETVEFDASPSELKSGPGETEGFRQEVIWDFGDGEQEVVKAEGETQAGLTASHEYATSGEYEATLRIRFKNPDYGNPLPVSHGVNVAVGAQWPLTVTKAGTGSGAVTSEPAGIDCGSACGGAEASFAEDTVVKLTGVPSEGSKIVVWSGCDAIVGSNECQVTMGAAKDVTATFELQQRLLEVTKNGTGSGTVTSEPAGIDCGSECEASYANGTLVKLTGTPAEGSKAVVWQSCPGTVNGSNQCEVTMTAAKEAVATFDLQQHSLEVTKNGTGSGTVTSEPAGIDCGSECEASYANGTLVKLTGTPAEGSKAVVWQSCPGTVNGSNQCEVTMTAAKEAVATFTRMTPELAVTLAGTGSGTVTSEPAGIDCGSECAEEFDFATVVKLTGSSAPGTKPVAWAGCDSVVGSNECQVTMSAAKNVTASFSLENKNPLTVTKAGSGEGTVTSEPAGIDCGSDCSEDFTEGTVVTLAGVAGPNSEAVAWSGCDSVVGANECQVTMSAAKNVTATFELEVHELAVTVDGTGSGTVVSFPEGIDCGSDCAEEYDHGEVVNLIAVADAGSRAASWEACPGTVNGLDECVVTVDAAKEAVATFDLEQHLLAVVANGTGSGTVTSEPAGIDCGSECEASFPHGTVVKLSGTPAEGTDPVAWSGCEAIVGANECEVTMGAARGVTATFDLAQRLLTITKDGGGSGTVTSEPAGIDCGSECEASFAHGQLVKLVPTPAAGSEFAGWGGACSGSGACEVMMDAAREVSATFVLERHLLTVTKAGTGSGAVTSDPAGIDCSSECTEDSEEYTQGTVVELTGTPDAGSKPVVWTGCDSLVGENECQVTVDAAKGVTAEFEPVDLVTLTVEIAGSGTGSVVSAPAGIDCGEDCTQGYEEATEVTLSATSGSHTEPVAWKGCDEVVGGEECRVTMATAREVTATFAPERHQLTVRKSGGGSGWVASDPASIGCGGTCLGSFDHGTVVSLKGISGPGTAPVAWQGCSGIDPANRCLVSVTGDVAVTAVFAPPAATDETPAALPDADEDKKKPTRQERLKAKRQRELKRCRKLNDEERRARCVRKAQRIGRKHTSAGVGAKKTATKRVTKHRRGGRS